MPLTSIEVSSRRATVALFPRRQTAEQQSALAFEMDEGSQTIKQNETTGYLLRNSASKYAVGYVSSEGKLKVFEADMFSVDGSLKRKQAESDLERESKTFFESRQELIEAYAPAKKQRQVKQAQNAQVKDERIEGKTGAIDGLKKDLSKKTPDTPLESGVLAMMREVLPDFDLTTEEVSKVYNFSSLYPDSLIATLSLDEDSAVDQTVCWLKQDCPLDGPYSSMQEIFKLRSFNRLGNIFLASKHMKNKTFARLFVICAGIFLFFKNRKSKLQSSAKQIVSEQIYNTFANIYGRGRLSNDMGDKLLCHLLLFILRLTPDFNFSFGLLVDDLQTLTHKDLQSVLEFLGCTVKNGLALNATLQAPLKVHQVFATKRRRH